MLSILNGTYLVMDHTTGVTERRQLVIEDDGTVKALTQDEYQKRLTEITSE
jgi:hypothetical protein